jgi:hypothetical protein
MYCKFGFRRLGRQFNLALGIYAFRAFHIHHHIVGPVVTSKYYITLIRVSLHRIAYVQSFLNSNKESPGFGAARRRLRIATTPLSCQYKKLLGLLPRALSQPQKHGFKPRLARVNGTHCHDNTVQSDGRSNLCVETNLVSFLDVPAGVHTNWTDRSSSTLLSLHWQLRYWISPPNCWITDFHSVEMWNSQEGFIRLKNIVMA